MTTLIPYLMLAVFSALIGALLMKWTVRADDYDEDDEVVERLPLPAPPPWTGMTLEHWRQRDDLIQWAASLYSTPQWHRLMEVLWNNQPYPPLGQDTEYAAQVGRINGYREALGVLRVLPEAPAVAPKEVPLDYSGDAFGPIDKDPDDN